MTWLTITESRKPRPNAGDQRRRKRGEISRNSGRSTLTLKQSRLTTLMTGLQDARQITVVSMNVNTPNLRLALAASYNERGILGFTNTVTNAIDQRKINSIYQPIVNAVTGGTTLYLAKRPGVDDSGQTYGATGQVGYLVHHAPAVYGSGTNGWLFSTSGDDQRASSTAKIG